MSENKRNKGGAHLQKKERTPRTKKEKIRLAVILVVVILLALVLIVFAVHQALVKPPEIERPSVDGDGIASGVIIPGVDTSGDRKEDFYTFLVVGRDTGGGGNTDTILLAAYDIPNQKLNVMSIPRDTMVNVSWDIKRINSVYNANGGGDKGIQALYTEVSQLVGFVPDFSVVVEWKAIGQMVDAIGGVWFEVPWNMNYDDPTQDLHIHINKGYQQLNGEQAMGVVRWRQNNDGSHSDLGDIGRIEIQQAFLKAVISQCLQLENVTKIGQFAQIFTENVQTNLTLSNLAWFGEQAIFGGLTMDNVNFMTMPGNYNISAWSRTYQNYQSYVTPYGDELLKMVNEYLNPYLEDRTADMQDIMSINSDGSLSSSTGVLEDSKAAQSSSTSKPATTPTTTPTPLPESSPEVIDEPGTPEETTPPNEPGPTTEPESPGVSEDPEVPEDPGVPEEPTIPDTPGTTEPENPGPAGGSEETPIPPPPDDEAA